ncbi:MAG: hypothetical protein HY072_08715, partial [Deltaproteobacteria bacterium]|nr:hypothetical protein [Deltaproteobacteria bacterium]
MHICNYCGTSFIPRAQTKKPKACTNRKCQKQRQRDNEKAWKIKNQGLYDGSYFRIKRLQRIKQLRKLAERWFKFLEVGSRFL